MNTGICTSDYNACQEVLKQYPNARSNWVDHNHCQFHDEHDFGKIVARLVRRDLGWEYAIYSEPAQEPQRRPEVELQQAVEFREPVRALLDSSNRNVQDKINKLAEIHDCTRYEAAMRYFQRLYDVAVECEIEGEMTPKPDPGYEFKYFQDKYGRQPENDEEHIKWRLEYEKSNTIPVSGGVRHHHIAPKDHLDNLMAMGSYPESTVQQVVKLKEDSKFSEALTLLSVHDIEHRKSEIVPIADDLRANSRHKISRVILEAGQELECMHEN